MKKKFLIGTSWKMYKTAAEAAEYLTTLKDQMPAAPDCQVYVTTPFTALWKAVEVTKDSPIMIGAQNMHWEDEGPFTGEVSPRMLKETGIQIIQIAHSERRAYYNETDQDVNKKVIAGLKHGLTPLVCIGERASDKEYGVSAEFLAIQVKIALHGLTPEEAKKVWIAYEPVWAIGVGGTPATPEYADAMQEKIRNVLTDLYGPKVSEVIPILYGGSVNTGNAVSLASMPNIDGIFIGRSCLNVETFLTIIREVSKAIAK